MNARPVVLPAPFSSLRAELYLGQGSNALEVVKCEGLPSSQIVEVWRARRGGRASPVLIVAPRADGTYDFCGVDGEHPPVIRGISESQFKAVTEHALELPDRHAAIRFCSRALESLETAHPGTRNSGLLTTHMVERGIGLRAGYKAACTRGEKVLGKSGVDLIRALGFSATTHKQIQLVRSKERKVAVAVLLQRDETPDAASQRLGSLSPVSYAFAEADKESVDYVLLVQDSVIRLYPTAMNVGVGRRSRTETFLEIDVRLLPPESAGLLWLAFSADALLPQGSLRGLLEESGRFAGTLAVNLRERIYGQVMPCLATAIANARPGKNKTVEKLAETYQMAVTVLFRLLFISYAEDKDLLPYKVDERYRNASLKRLASELQSKLADSERYGSGRYLWDRIAALFRAVDTGNDLLGVPQYNGGLFSEVPEVSPTGYLLSKISLTDAEFGPALENLLLIEDSESRLLGPVDFRSLSVREFGTVYEGLLESALSVAETDLSLDKDDHYVPSKARDEIVVTRGAFYLHNKSGARKASGSFFTKEFAVSALLDSALEPALAEHCTKLDKLDEVEAGLAFFDFRICDLAMGSGHFLVSAVDRIERAFSGYLARRNLPLVRKEFTALRNSAMGALKRYADSYEIEDAQLLRRQIAKRCVYGVDLNETSVQLARLAVWVHTFVPGLPLSFLDHNLAHGNSLVGIGTIQEMDLVKKQLADEDGDQMGLISTTADELLSSARKHLQRLATISDATYDEVQKSRVARDEASKAIANTTALFDVSIADRIREHGESGHLGWEHVSGDTPVADSAAHKWALKKLGGLHPLHFPARFPEVFLRTKASGFDVLLGNPPWDKVMFEEPAFWMRHIPGFRGMGQNERSSAIAKLLRSAPQLEHELEEEKRLTDIMHAVLTRAAAHKFGSAHPDLYQAFIWRFWELVKNSGYIGLVLPRVAFGGEAMEEWRRLLLLSGSKATITSLENKAEWVFDGVDPRYTVSLFSVKKGSEKASSAIFLDGPPYRSLAEFEARTPESSHDAISGDVAVSWASNAALPILPSRRASKLFEKLRRSPRFADVAALRPQQYINGTTEKHLFVFAETAPAGYFPVFTGESFDLWKPDTGRYYAYTKPEVIVERLMERRAASRSRKASVYSFLTDADANDARTLDCMHPRIAFRDVTRSTDTRTFRCALIPGKTVTIEKAPILTGPQTPLGTAFYLACLSSRTFDWYARRWVETKMSFGLLGDFPAPVFDPTNKAHLEVAAFSAGLAAIDKRYAEWANGCNVKYGSISAKNQLTTIINLEARIARLYGLDQEDVTFIYQTFHTGWDYRPELEAVLAHF